MMPNRPSPDEIAALLWEMDKRFPKLKLKGWEAELPLEIISLTELMNRAIAALEALAQENERLRRELSVAKLLWGTP